MHCHKIKLATITFLALAFAGCNSTKSVPITVNSEPLGAQVLYQVKGPESISSDWIYLGNTPLNTQRRIDTSYFNQGHVFTLRVMKDGFIEQTREWSGDDIEDSVDDGERVFWTSVLVRARK